MCYYDDGIFNMGPKFDFFLNIIELQIRKSWKIPEDQGIRVSFSIL